MKRPSEDIPVEESSHNLTLRRRVEFIMDDILTACHDYFPCAYETEPVPIHEVFELSEAMERKDVQFLVRRFYQVLEHNPEQDDDLYIYADLAIFLGCTDKKIHAEHARLYETFEEVEYQLIIQAINHYKSIALEEES